MRRKPSLGALKWDKKPSLDELADYPGMTSWFNPKLLGQLLLRVIISDVFGQYADRRLIEAALDPATKIDIQQRDNLSDVLPKDADGAVWIDFVADLGDGFDATYAVAYLLAQDSLTVGGETLPRGGALFMGGDEVYPTASRDEYNIKMRAPYYFASPNVSRSKHPPVFAIPGNHDWYDGLVNFLAFFARQKLTPIGNWRTQQKRSYFAARLNDLCWLWAIDIALVADMDQPQADYFVAVAEAMPQGGSVILCSAEPGWYKTGSGSYRTLSYAAKIAQGAGKALRIPLVLSGDTHHYSRYSSEDGTEYITSGGGGAFLHGTHHLPPEIKAKWLRNTDEKLTLEKLHPPVDVSRNLLWGDFAFPFKNPGFAATLGGLYALFGYLWSLRPCWDVTTILFAVFAGGFGLYATYQEGRSIKVLSLSLIHTAIHFGALLLLTLMMLQFDAALLSFHDRGPWWAWLLFMALPVGVFGGAIGGFIFGANLFFTCRFANMNHNDAFSAMRLDSFRHFLRLRIVGDQITVYPVGFDKTPARNAWRDNPEAGRNSRQSFFLPPDDFAFGLIEPKIVIHSNEAAKTHDVKGPGELPSDEKQ